MKKVAFYTLGCKLNFSETSSISRDFEDKGFKKVDFNDNPDIFVINTCSVTENADKKCRKLVRDAKKVSPDSYVVIIGCYAQLKPTEIVEIPGVDAVLGASEKFKLLEILGEFKKESEAKIYATDIKEVNEFAASYSLNDRTRTFLKVQDGCNYNCTFCTIPLARGKSRSATIEDIVKNAKEIAATEVKEVVLTGVNIGDFGIVDGKRQERFLDLLIELDKIDGIDRFRISSIEPNLLTDDIIEFVASSKKFVPHFHIPLQSGSDELLKSMRRRYDTQLYVDRVNKIKTLMPNCCIGVDVIIGFPGETDDLFKETYQFLTDLDISYLHVFTYSERDNTPAKDYANPVPFNKRHERSKMLRILSEKKRHFFYTQNIDKAFTVLFESKEENGFINGFTENYIKISVPFDEQKVNKLIELKLTEVTEDSTALAEVI